MSRIRPLIVMAVLLIVAAQGQQDSTSEALQDQIEKLRGQLEGFQEMFAETNNAVETLKKLKFSGYVQSQFQSAQTAGIASFAGGNFPSATATRFSVRRGRLKAQYTNDLTLSRFVLQIDVTQGGVGIKDAYVSVKDPWTRFIAVTAGIFDRPFGFEISYSSSSRENPERTRLFQTLFPGERELGAKIEVLPSQMLFNGEWLSYFNLKAGFFNGTGSTTNENDSRKDFIGRLGMEFPLADINLAIDGGVSLYRGSARANSKKVYSVNDAMREFVADSTASNLGNPYDRSYLGADVQVYYDLPVLGGISVRAEYIQGSQPSTSADNKVYTSATADLYRREFRGFYVNVIQNIGVDHQVVLRYDQFDPNTQVTGANIGATATARLTEADIAYSTIGVGYIYHWDDNVKFVFYYDLVTNESVSISAPASLAPYKTDVNDNVLTFRTQFRF